MNTQHRIHFPVATLIHNGNFIRAAAQAHPEISTRLAADYLTETANLLVNVISDVASQKTAKGTLGGLTMSQHNSLDVLQHFMNQARKTARLAFPGLTVKLHQEFQMGENAEHNIGALLARADIILASLKNADNLASLKLKGWTDTDTQAFEAARQAFGPAEQYRETAKGGAKDSTTAKAAAAANLYEHLLTIQNAADLQWPATNPNNAGVRDEFRLNTFPPSHAAATPAPPPAPQTAGK